jgi:glycosyltransferase involved in cell wall biosynthesis
MSVIRRLRAFINFMLKATRISLKQKNIELVIATSTPLTVGMPALFLKWLKKVPYIFEVRDLWPEVPIQMGAIRNIFLIKTTRYLEKIIYRNAKHIIALSPGMQDGVLKYVLKEKISMIPNMAKIDVFYPREKNHAFMQKLGLSPHSFKVIHFGALGIANGAATIIESAKLLKNDPTIEFLFVGGGATEKELVEKCIKYKLNNVKFLGKFAMQETSEIVNLSDISIVSFKDLPILYTNSPNKLFDSLSAGKPIIINSAGWTKNLVEENNCGCYVNPNNPANLAEKIKTLQSNPKLVEEMGRNARLLAETQYDKSILCKQFVQIIET